MPPSHRVRSDWLAAVNVHEIQILLVQHEQKCRSCSWELGMNYTSFFRDCLRQIKTVPSSGMIVVKFSFPEFLFHR